MDHSAGFVLLRLGENVVGTGQYLGSSSAPIRTLHGHSLGKFAMEGQDLVAVRNVQVFDEFKDEKYPYSYHCFDGPPERLGDLNDSSKHFKAIIAWDNNDLLHCSSSFELGEIPARVSRRNFSIPNTSRLVAKRVHFGEVTFIDDASRPRPQGEYDGEMDALSHNAFQNARDDSVRKDFGTSRGSQARDIAGPECSSLRDTEEGHGRGVRNFSERQDPDSEGLDASLLGQPFARQPGPMAAFQSVEPSVSTQAQIGEKRSQFSLCESEGNESLKRQKRRRTESRSSNGDEITDVMTDHRERTATDNERYCSLSARPSTDSSNTRSDSSAECDDETRMVGSSRQGHCEVTGDIFANGEETQNSSEEDDGSVHESDCNEELPIRKRRYTYKTRKKGYSRRNGIREHRLAESRRLDNPFEKKRKCCGTLLCFDVVNKSLAFREYKKYMRLRSESPELYRNALESLLSHDGSHYEFNGREVCTRFMRMAFKFSNDLQSAVKKTVLGVNTGSLRGIGVRHMPKETLIDTGRDIVVRYLREMAEETGDVMPNSSFTNLPDKQKSLVYKQFESFHKEHHPEKLTPSLSYFYSVWKQECREIRTRKHHGFTRCTICEDLRSRFIAERGNHAALQILRDEKRLHNKVMREERLGYMARAERAARNPRKYCSLIIDGADQKNYGLPHFSESTKSDRGHKLKVKCVGVLEHLKDNKLSLYTLTEEFETGANHVLEAVHRTLDSRKQRFGRLSEVLYVQADNCTRENKNRFFMTYFEMLVARGVFIEVQVSFLPVGHTHADIDQAFSCVSKRLKVRDARTMNEMLHELGQCYLPKATATRMPHVANFSGLCKLTNCFNKIKGFSKFRYFRFSRLAPDINATGYYETECHVKIQGYEQWKPISVPPGQKGFLKFVPDLRNTPPTTTMPPDNVTEVNKCLESMISRVKDTAKMSELQALRDEVYKQREDPFHWNLATSIEMNGDYLRGSAGGAMWIEHMAEENRAGSEYEYCSGTLVAVRTEGSANCKFWIAQVLGVATTNEDGHPTELKIVWYSAQDDCADEFTAKYKIARTYDTVRGRLVNYSDKIDVSTVLVQFESLTRDGFLRMSTQNCIRQTLHMN